MVIIWCISMDREKYKHWKFLEKRPFFRADMAGLGNTARADMAGLGSIGLINALIIPKVLSDKFLIFLQSN